MRTDVALQRLADAHREIVAVYLFGSQTTGQSGPLSDLDVAVLLTARVRRPAQRLDHRLRLMHEIVRACRRPDVDVVLLNEASPLLAYEVVRGRLLYERNHSARVAFEARVIQRYLDLAPFLATSRRYLKRQLMNGTFGG